MLSWPGSRLRAPGSRWGGEKEEKTNVELNDTDSTSADQLRRIEIISLDGDWLVFGALGFIIDFYNFILNESCCIFVVETLPLKLGWW